MYQLYIANKNYSSWSLRPWVLMRVLGIEFEERFVVFESSGNFERFREFSPSGKVPCLVDGETAVWDSLAIAEYLAEQHATVWPQDRKARAWARSAAAEMHSGFATLRDICTMNCGIRVRLFDTPPALKADIERINELWNEGLQRFGGKFLTGDQFTAVDAFFAPVAFRVQTYGIEMKGAARDYAPRLLELEAMQQWYTAALAETYREDGHEAEAKRAGTIVTDLRATA